MRAYHHRNRVIVGLLAAAAAGTAAGTARADTQCGSTTAGWNVPAGGAVFEIAPGNINDVLVSLGEERSHSMLSHGPNTWVTHATSTTPPYAQDCHNPVDVNFMGASTPGLSTINQGAAYTFLYLNGGAPTNLYYQNTNSAVANTGALLANQWLPSDEWGDVWSWNPMNVNGNTVWGMNFAFNNGTTSSPSLSPVAPIYYGWYQYMSIGNTAAGIPSFQTGGNGLAKGYGVTCSSSLAMQQHDALWNQAGYTGDVRPRTYGSSLVTKAANVLFGDIYNVCNGATNTSAGGSFDVAVWSGLACLFISVCSNAANQVVNAFASPGGFVDDVPDWQNVVATQSAYSISPDDIGCWNSNGTGAPCNGSGSSVWGWDSSHFVQWNSPGNTYGCW